MSPFTRVSITKWFWRWGSCDDYHLVIQTRVNWEMSDHCLFLKTDLTVNHGPTHTFGRYPLFSFNVPILGRLKHFLGKTTFRSNLWARRALWGVSYSKQTTSLITHILSSLCRYFGNFSMHWLYDHTSQKSVTFEMRKNRH